MLPKTFIHNDDKQQIKSSTYSAEEAFSSRRRAGSWWPGFRALEQSYYERNVTKYTKPACNADGITLRMTVKWGNSSEKIEAFSAAPITSLRKTTRTWRVISCKGYIVHTGEGDRLLSLTILSSIKITAAVSMLHFICMS